MAFATGAGGKSTRATCNTIEAQRAIHCCALTTGKEIWESKHLRRERAVAGSPTYARLARPMQPNDSAPNN
eukprot:11214801-Lingulodinium_polyedra.AAC.1